MENKDDLRVKKDVDELIQELRANATAHPLDVRQQVLADAADALAGSKGGEL